jgi:Uma2 family endonuclease
MGIVSSANGIRIMATMQKMHKVPSLENGDHLDQKTFHARYLAMRENKRAELIGGIVYMPSPQKIPHGRYQYRVLRWLGEYAENTPGTEVLVNSTSILGDESEPEPDGCLYISPECGGQTAEDSDGFLVGAPELLAEIAWSTESIDLNAKKTDYEKAGVREYIVVALRMKRVFWFIRRRSKFRELTAGADNVYRSEVFPGLWLDPAALLSGDSKRILAVVRQGIASPEHAVFYSQIGIQVTLAFFRPGQRLPLSRAHPVGRIAEAAGGLRGQDHVVQIPGQILDHVGPVEEQECEAGVGHAGEAVAPAAIR